MGRSHSSSNLHYHMALQLELHVNTAVTSIMYVRIKFTSLAMTFHIFVFISVFILNSESWLTNCQSDVLFLVMS